MISIPTKTRSIIETMQTPSEQAKFEHWLALVDNRCWTLADVTLCDVIDRFETASDISGLTGPGLIRFLAMECRKGRAANPVAAVLVGRMQRIADTLD